MLIQDSRSTSYVVIVECGVSASDVGGQMVRRHAGIDDFVRRRIALAVEPRASSRWQCARATAAGDWPRGKLATFLAIAVALQWMTIWNLDLAAQQQLEMLRIEAGQLGQSVAPPPVADRDNAAIFYEQAAEAMGPDGSWPKAFADFASDWTVPHVGSSEPLSPQLRQVLHDWGRVAALLHEAASKPGYYVDREYYRPAMTIVVSDQQKIRCMASVLALDGQEKAATGDMRGAIQDINTRLVMARHVAAEPFLVAMLISVILERNALSTLQGLLQAHQVPAADLATLRIENGPSYRKLLERALRFGNAVLLTAFYEVGEGQLSKILYHTSSDGQQPPGNHAVLDAVFAPVYRVFLLPGEIEAYRRLSREMHEAAGKPYGKAKPLWGKCETEARWDGGVVLNLFAWAASSFDQAATQADATRQTARLGVAAYLYREKNGHFPAKLSDLAPKFILSLPADPFDGKPMKFKRTPHGIVIYSVGPDMIDTTAGRRSTGKHERGTSRSRCPARSHEVFQPPGSSPSGSFP